QEALLTDLPFDIHDFQALRTCYSFGGLADLFQIHAKTPRPKPVLSSFPPAATKKWACAHSMVRPVSERRASIFPQHCKRKVPRGLDTGILADPGRRSSPHIGVPLVGSMLAVPSFDPGKPVLSGSFPIF